VDAESSRKIIVVLMIDLLKSTLSKLELFISNTSMVWDYCEGLYANCMQIMKKAPTSFDVSA
jgi:hypothetical protein